MNATTTEQRQGAETLGAALAAGEIHASGRAAGVPVTRDLTLAYACSLFAAALMSGISGVGLVFGTAGLYGAEAEVVRWFVGQDAANLVVGLPILFGTLWLARRGSPAGLLVWPGALYYVLYTYALYLIGAPFSALFLAYVLLATLSAFTTIGIVASIDGDAVMRRLAAAPARAIGSALVGVGVLATIALTSLVIPALSSPTPVAPLQHARWIVDYAVGNSVLLIGGVLLWRRAALGYATAGGLLFLSGVNGVAFAVGGVVGALATAASIDAPVIAVHLAIGAACFALLAVFLRGTPSARTTESGGSPAPS